MIPYGRHWTDEQDAKAVAEVIISGQLTQGAAVEEFEKELASFCGAKYALAASSGTAALHLACLAAGIKNGDEVITTPMTFVATANAPLYCGAKPVFADIQTDTRNIDPEKIMERITGKTRALIPVHFGGLPCDMEAISGLAREKGLAVIEDACHAFGAQWRDSKGGWHRAGSCSHSDMAVFSFHPVKHFTTGEGGAVLTNDSGLYRRLLSLRCHGITRSGEDFVNRELGFTGSSQNKWYYEMNELGFNYRLSDLNCALGLSQLRKAGQFLEARRAIARRYDEELSGIRAVKIRRSPDGTRSAHHLYIIESDFTGACKDRPSVIKGLERLGVGTQVHYIPVHMQPYYAQRFGYLPGDYPVAEDYYRRALSLPIYPKMSPQQIDKVISSVAEVLG